MGRHLPYGITQCYLPPDTKWMRPALTPANQASTRFTNPGRMEGWVDLGSLIAARLGIEPTTTWSQVWCPNHYSTKPSVHLCVCACVYDVVSCCCQWQVIVSVWARRMPVISAYLVSARSGSWFCLPLVPASRRWPLWSLTATPLQTDQHSLYYSLFQW